VAIEPRHDQPQAVIDVDRRECDAEARRDSPTIGDAVGDMLTWKIAGFVGGAIVGAGLGLGAAAAANQDERGFVTIAAGTAIGAAIGYVVGTVYGARQGMREHAEQIGARFRACMRSRGYDVIRY
jgi:hypothetical protein